MWAPTTPCANLLQYRPQLLSLDLSGVSLTGLTLVQETRIELTSQVWKTRVLPLYYSCIIQRTWAQPLMRRFSGVSLRWSHYVEIRRIELLLFCLQGRVSSQHDTSPFLSELLDLNQRSLLPKSSAIPTSPNPENKKAPDFSEALLVLYLVLYSSIIIGTTRAS